MLVQACLNGNRHQRDHPALPLTPQRIAEDAAAAVRAGAGAVHIHPRGTDTRQSLDPADIGAACEAMRELVPALPIGVSTAAWIEPDARRRAELIRTWRVLPDLASVNLHEDGSLELIELLNELGVGVEAGIWSVEDAALFVDEGLDTACARVLVEVDSESDPDAACALAAAIDIVLDDGLVEAPRLHHGAGRATWGVIDAAIANGHDVRIGLEDTLVDAAGNPALSNAALIAAVVQLARDAGRTVDSA